MTTNRTILALACLAAAAGSSHAAESFGDRARVISTTPVYERIPVTREECWNERQRVYEDRRVIRSDTGAPIGAGTVLGAVIGGAVGRQFADSNRGRNQGTAAGAVVGGLIGNQIERDAAGPWADRERVELERVPVERNVERCHQVNEVREATVGYEVRYEYNGHTFTTQLDRDPGRMLRVRVELTPEEGHGPPPRPLPAPRSPAYR